MKILTIVGARPQFIKAAVVSRAIEDYNKTVSIRELIEEMLVHTGQHYDDNMSDVFFKEMHIPIPRYQLGIGGGTHGAMTGRMLEALEGLMLEEKPDVVLVYGDTNSTLAGALAAAKLHIPVAHVEAGLRSFNMQMPEEVNRILTDRVSHWLFCPTDTAVNNLKREGVNEWSGVQVHNVGDVMYDAALFYRERAAAGQTVAELMERYKEGFYLATVHRQENTDDVTRLTNIITALEEIAKRVPVILPLHPRTRKRLEGLGIETKQITCLEPVGYFDMVCLLDNCRAVFTDSGGVQKEAYFFHKPCITLRDETEWVELVEHGFNCLVGAEWESIIRAEQEFIQQDRDFSVPLYGDGRAGEKIILYLLKGKQIGIKENEVYVSIVIPILNEKMYIKKCIESVLAQDYPQDNYEILLVDGCSTDGTREIIRTYIQTHKKIKLLDNPKQIAPSAMNIGITNAHGDLVVIMGAHADYASDYISKCVKWSQITGAENVGGPALAKGDGFWGKAIEYAHYSPFGLGGADFRTGEYEGETDTVFGGAFRRDIFDKVGLYDERLVRNQDIELNSRIRNAGGKIFITPEIKCSYYCRSNLKGLWQQNYNNGLWNIYTSWVSKSALSLRHFVPLLFVSGLIMSMLFVVFGSTVTSSMKGYLFVPLILCAGSYIAVAVFFALKVSMEKGLRYFFPLLVVFATLHISYGWGSIKGLLSVKSWREAQTDLTLTKSN